MSSKDTCGTEHSVMFTSGEAPVGPGEQFGNSYAQKILTTKVQVMISGIHVQCTHICT